MKRMYNYELFHLTEAELAALRRSETPDDLCLLGRWYWITAPTDDYIERAADCFRRAQAGGNADASMHLASMMLHGELGPVNIEEYYRQRDAAAAQGSEAALMAQCRNEAYGILDDGDMDSGIASTERCMRNLDHIDPEWYDMLGWMYVAVEDNKQAEEAFRKAIAGGYSDGYTGLLQVCDVREEALAAGCGFAALLYAQDMEKEYEALRDQNGDPARMAELDNAIMERYKQALAMGENIANYYLGGIYHDGLYGFPEDDEAAWQYYMRGSQLGNAYCMEALAEMTMEGRAPEGYHYSDVCLFGLRSLRYGNRDELAFVVRCYRDEGELQAYADEIERYYIPLFEAEEEPEDDDGRYDPYA